MTAMLVPEIPVFDPRPCTQCGARVRVPSGVCESCEARHLRPQVGPQSDFLACSADIALFGGGMGGGKQLRLDEPIPTPGGWSTIGDLVPGDLVFDEHGRPVQVTHVHPIDLAPESYRITFSCGATIEACADHLWLAGGVVTPTRSLHHGDRMPVAPQITGPCRIDGVPSSRFVTSVEPVAPSPMRCITVDNPTGLFLVGPRHLVTHNTYSLLLDWLRHANTPGANGLIVRNMANSITIRGGLWDEALKLYAGTGAHPRGGNAMDISWPNGATLSFRHLDDRNVERFKGPGFSWIGIEEANECSIEAISWLLLRNRSNCGARPVMRLTCNPDPDHPLAQWVEPYLHLRSDHPDYGEADRTKSGTILWMLRSVTTEKFVFGSDRSTVGELAGQDPGLALSFSFVPSLLGDNPALDLADPSYRRKFAAMDGVTRKKNEKGNWKSRAEAGGMLRRSRWGGIIDTPLATISRRVRGWDRAATKPRPGTNPDFTIGLKMYWDIQGRFYVAGLAVCRDEPSEVDTLMETTAEMDGPKVTQAIEIDPAQAGKAEESHTREFLERTPRCGPVVSRRASEAKVKRAGPISKELADGMPVDGEYIPSGRDLGLAEARGFILDEDGWFDEPYTDAGTAPSTLGELFWAHVAPFFDPSPTKKKDVVDAMTTAHAAGREEEPEPVDPAKRWAMYTT